MFDCQDCSRRTHCRMPVGPTIVGKSGVFVLLDSPNTNDDKLGRLCTSPSLKANLVDWLRKDFKTYAVATAVCCAGESKPGFKQLDACRNKWLSAIKSFNPKVVLVLGAGAIEAVLCKKEKVGKLAGTSAVIDYNGVKIPTVFGVNPKALDKARESKGGASEKLIESYFNTWELLLRVFHEGLTEIPPVTTITEYGDVVKFLKTIQKTKSIITYDYETWGDRNTLRPELNDDFKILTCGVATKSGGFAFPLQYPGHYNKYQYQTVITEWLKTLELGKKNLVVAHNSKYEHKCNLKCFSETQPLKDTLLMSTTLNEIQSASLGQLASRCGIGWANYKTEMGDIQQNPIDTPLPELLTYNALDALITREVYMVLEKDVKKSKLSRVVRMREIFAQSLAEVETVGMHVNLQTVSVVKNQLSEELEKFKKQLYKSPQIHAVECWAKDNIKSFKEGSRFNAKSTTQMKRLCLDVLKLDVKPTIENKGTSKEKIKYCFDKRALAKYEEKYPVIKTLQRIRSIEAMFTGFLNKWESFTCGNNCVHSSLNQEIVVTGRLSSTDPNLQNIPKRDAETGGLALVRKVFDSRFKNGWIINADYKQIEPRLLAGISGDEGMIKALVGGFDLHRYVAAEIYGVKYDDVTDIQRDLGKRMNLGTMYGQTEYGLSAKANISIEMAKELMAEYDRRFAGVAQFRKDCHSKVIRDGYIKDLFGAVRHLPDAQSNNYMVRNRALRQSANFVIQSTANSFCLIGLNRTQSILRNTKAEALVTSTVHDSISAECSDKHLDLTCKLIKMALLVHNTAPYWKNMGVPMAVDIEVGKNLFDLTEREVKNAG